MSEGIEMAKAYVQIVPSAQGIRAALTDVFGEETDGLGEKTGQSIGAQLVGTIKKVVAAAGIGKLISDSLNMGGALQQSIGGIETLFGAGGRSIEEYAQSVGKSVDEVKDEYASLMQSQQIVFDNAKQAYKTVGLSANDYMEQTTSFAASLLSSVSQDTNAAAQLANMAMVDMADNANKMGTDMQDIQNAYQGFAKQNYTMLDNLKLGYGGTQAEMQRLLKDAEKISGVHYDLGNLADMYSAIHVIQQEMDITGTTAKEASTTLTGSFASMKAAAENVLADWSTGADLTEPLQALAGTAQTFLEGNLLPMIGNMLQGIPQLVYTLVPTILQSGTDLLNSLAEGFAQGIPDFLSNALPQLLSFTEELRANAGSFVDAGLNMITQLVNGLIAGLPDLIAYVPDIIINICGIINDNMPKILAQGVSLIVQLVVGIGKAVPDLLANWKKILQAVLSVISAVNWLNIGKSLLTHIASGVKSMGSSLLAAFKGGFSSALKWLWELPGKLFQLAKTAIQNFINGLTGAGSVATAVTAGLDLAETASGDDSGLNDWIGANSDLADSAQDMADIAIPAYTKSGDAAAASSKKTIQQTMETVRETALSVTSTFDAVVDGIQTNTKTVTETLTDGTTQQKQVITETQTEVLNGMLVTVERARTIAADGTESVAETIKQASADSFSGLTKGWQEEAEKGVLGTFDTLVTAVKKQDWQSVGKWVLSTLYNGLAPETKQLIDDTGKALIQQVNGVLKQGVSQLANGAWKLGGQICDGLTSGLGDVISRFSGLGGTLTDIFSGLKAPLTAAATAISKGLQGGLLSSFPSILASLGSLIGSIGSAFVGMLQAIGAALFPTGFGAPQAILMIAAGAALAATIAAIVASVGGSFKKSTVTGSTGTAGSTVTGATGTLWDYEKTAPLPQRQQRPNVEVNQYIYSKAQTAADLMREAQYEQERAVLAGV